MRGLGVRLPKISILPAGSGRSGRATAAVVAASLALGGCAGDKVEAIYSITAAPEVPAEGATAAQILIPEPAALQSLNTANIAVAPSPNTLSYYEKVAWEDTAPKVFQRVMLATFQNSGRVKATGLPGQSLLINYQIVTELRAFQAETFDADRARVEVAVKLLNDSNGRVLDSRTFEATVPLAGDGPDSASLGLETASRAVAAEVLQWTLSRI